MKVVCPLPKASFEVITLGHGSGGLLTNQLLDNSIFRILYNEKKNDEQHDGAFIDLAGNIAYSTDSFIVSPIFFPGGNIGELAVNGTVNDLSMCGAIPKFLSLSFIIEEGLKISEFEQILHSIKSACLKAEVTIVTGDTKVVEKGKGDKLFINTSGIGVIPTHSNISANRVKPGDKIILSGNIATHGMAIMSVRDGLEFESGIESDTTHLNHTVSALLEKHQSSVKFLTDPTRGGVATVLNELVKKIYLGINLIDQHIPINPLVSSACEILGLDPLYVANEGIFLAIVDAEDSEDIVKFLHQNENGKNAAIIGEVVENHPNQVILTSKIGGQRLINMMPGEQLPRIC